MDQHLACLPPVRTGTNSEIDVRFGYCHLIKENLRHTVIVVLAGMYQKFRVTCLAQRLAHGGSFDELGARAHNGQNFHAQTILSGVGPHGSQSSAARSDGSAITL